MLSNDVRDGFLDFDSEEEISDPGGKGRVPEKKKIVQE